MGAGWVSIELGTKGPLMSQCTACAASNMAIGDALDEIRMGRADAMIAGGTRGADHARRHRRLRRDAGALAPQRRSQGASRPFDKGRDGLVMGEAAGALVLEELGARRRAARRSTLS